MNKCKNCEELVDYESVYCNKCGTKLKASLLDEHVSFVIDIGNGIKIPSNPITFEYCFKIGANAYHRGEYYEAIEYLRQATTFNEPPINELSNCYNELGISYIRIKKYDIAAKYLELAISANPDSLMPRENLVTVLIQLDLNRAIDAFKNLAINNPNFNPLLWRSMGIACENEKKYVDAKKFYEKAIMLGIEEAKEDLQDVIRKMN